MADGWEGQATVEERERYSVGVRQDRNRPFAGPRWVTGMMPVSCGRGGTDLTGAHVVLRRTVGTTYSLCQGVSTYFERVDKGFP